MRKDRPRVTWRGDRWVHPRNTDMHLMPTQVAVYGGFARAAAAKRVWLHDMAKSLHTQSRTMFVSDEEKTRAAKDAASLSETADAYHEWALALVEQGL